MITKEWGAASPQLFQALTTNELLSSVELEFTKVNPNGEEYVYHTIKLTNAVVSEIKQYTRELQVGSGQPGHTAPTATDLEEISFTFAKLEIEDLDGKTTAVDDWRSS